MKKLLSYLITLLFGTIIGMVTAGIGAIAMIGGTLRITEKQQRGPTPLQYSNYSSRRYL